MVLRLDNIVKIISNQLIAFETYEMRLDAPSLSNVEPGQFINIKLEDSLKHFLRRPISICDYSDHILTIVYKMKGSGTKELSMYRSNQSIDFLGPLGHGFVPNVEFKRQLVVGGGIGIPPLYMLVKELVGLGITCDVVLGFQSKKDVFYQEQFEQLGVNVYICTMDGSMGYHGNVVDAITYFDLPVDYYYTCGPEKMLFALIKKKYNGQLSFEERMGCGFGACMGCSHKTIESYKRICKEGPVLLSSEVYIND